jgi:cysteine-rich repeat protein
MPGERRFPTSIVLLPAAVAIVAGSAAAFTDLGAGKRLVAKGAGTSAAKLVLKFGPDPNLVAPVDPRCPAETTIQLVSDTQVGAAQPLDCAAWKATGNGFRYADKPGGPGTLRKVTYKSGRLTVKLKGPPYADTALGGPVAFVETRITIGAQAYCGRWESPPGVIRRNEADRVVFKGPTGPCQVVCGDGIVQAPEACDDGNTRNDDCCTTACTVAPDDSACTDRTGCTTGDVCHAGVCQGTLRAPWINEFDYDDFAALNDDRDEFVEIAGPAGTDLGGYSVVAVEGRDGSCATPLGSTPGNANMSVTIPPGSVLADDTGTGIGFFVVCFYYTSGFVPGCDVVLPAPFTDSNLQNGHLTNADLFSCPDGILLLDAGNGYVDSVSYEGQVPDVGFFGPFFHLAPPYVAERDEGWLSGVSIEKTTSTLTRATSAAEWRDPSEFGNALCSGQLGLACPTYTRTPGTKNPLQTLACGSPSGAFPAR